MTLTHRYNEMFDDNGHPRPAYCAFATRTGVDPQRPSADTASRLANGPLHDSYAIVPVPLVLDDAEYRDTIAPGVRQRALALQAVFHDLINGEQDREPPSPLPEGLFAELVDQLGENLNALRRWWNGRPREEVRFTYAPDLVRGPDGRWCVLEDNVGCVGGVVDATLVLETYLAHAGATLHARVPHACGLTRAIAAFLQRVGADSAASPRVAAARGCAGDPEANRRRQTLEAAGLRVLDNQELHGALHQPQSAERVDIVVNFDCSAAWARAATLLEREADGSGVRLMTSPGVELLGNKAFLPFVDDVVTRCSGVRPVLGTAQTSIYREMPEDPTGWVVKESRGRQGLEVHFLDALAEVSRVRLGETIATRGTAAAVMQRYIAASYVPVGGERTGERFQVELRPFAWVIGDGVCVVGDTVSARGFRNVDGWGVGNMSRGAWYVPVIREPIH